MSRIFSRGLLAFFGLLVVSGAVAFGHHNATLARIFDSPTEPLSAAVLQPHTQAIPGERPLVRIFLAGDIERDSKKIAVENAGAVMPGEVLNFTLSSVNEGGAPAREYRAIGQIPPGATYVTGSAVSEGNTKVTYSIDDGKEFSTSPMIDEKQPDGTIKKVVAPISMYTQVRFEWADPLVAGGKLVASYQVRVK
ncbi:MAG TPA: hypothetical protein VIT88_13480 [Pyrinomonadaceae bacterium]